VVSAYYPISFTPPPNDPHGITRAQLAADLQATLVASPLYAPGLLPLLLEKLGASLRCVPACLGSGRPCVVRWAGLGCVRLAAALCQRGRCLGGCASVHLCLGREGSLPSRAPALVGRWTVLGLPNGSLPRWAGSQHTCVGLWAPRSLAKNVISSSPPPLCQALLHMPGAAPHIRDVFYKLLQYKAAPMWRMLNKKTSKGKHTRF
jgi:hypothetical protein